MTPFGSLIPHSPLGCAVVLGAASLLAGCASMDSLPPERLAEVRTRAQACNEALPAISRYDVDGSGRVWATAQGPDAGLIERNFADCVAARGRWTAWAPGQPAPMLEPLGPDNPDPNPALRVP
ncbi:MAG TPA: hypothetical protein VIE44_07415 [Methylomirabilota bacterium]|jgi:hypothetical protein